ncbi:hypothetical protein AAGG91_002750 [Salmonella enterica]|uniref:hypothetical protein n=1 Tax=Salmonella enterica TaxID=28901 RepID=UPI000FDFA67E|nr:hypothetical protein CPT_Munch_522 [Salmonella phage Munch]EHX8550736.1 hypothetical protein [Salmonella enterica]ELL7856368.1 hypothetical protein [Salmonella enterica]EME3782955.1 hypothetical protein [Salmonella enterica]MCP0435480.1 hypothetical protein [Salmonella enterica subsp. enterica serovar Mbandaka]
MNSNNLILKEAIHTLCVLRCQNLQMIYEGNDNTSKEKEIEAQEKFIKEFIDEHVPN